MNKYAIYTNRIIGCMHETVLLKYEKLSSPRVKTFVLSKNYEGDDDTFPIGEWIEILKPDDFRHNLYLVKDTIRFKAVDDQSAILMYKTCNGGKNWVN